MAGRAAQVYELTRNPRPYASALFGAGFWASGTGSVVAGDGETSSAVVFVVIGSLLAGNATNIFLRWPTRIVVRDDGLVFEALTYDRLVPWADLVSVRVSHGRYGGGIRWKLARRPHVASAATFENLHRLLVEVERRAPQATVTP